jgi:hypothetical protein
MAFHMYMVVVPEGKKKWTNAKGNTECVEFVRRATGAPPTALWKPGLHVRATAPGVISPYTAIATFDKDSKYPSDELGRHAAVYLSHDSTGIRVLDQWNAQGEVLERTIFFNRMPGTRRSNDGDTFYVVERAQ